MHANLNSEIGFSLYKTGMIFRREALREIKDYGVTPEQWQVLMTVGCGQKRTQREILEVTMQDAPTLSRTIARMKKNGLINKEAGERDKRLTYISATEKGMSLMTKIAKRHVKSLDNALSKFPKKSKDSLLRLLSELRDCFPPANIHGGRIK